MMTNGTDRKLTIGKDTMAISVRSRDLFPMTSTEYFESDIHSPTDSSEDSVEVKICPISVRNKRKCAEPRKVQDSFSGPMKKRMCLKVKAETGSEVHPFRPWSPKPAPASFVIPSTPSPTPTCQTKPVGSYFRPPSPIKAYDCEQPVALVKKRESIPQPCDMKANPSMLTVPALRVPVHPQIAAMSSAETDRMILSSSDVFPMLSGSASRREQRNYKNMTRERRIEANARERTRVHTISAAFDTLRRSVPAYSHNQKLSKLSVLRIACSYIMTLSSIVDEDSDGPSTAECAEMVSRTIQREGKLRKKKDDND